MWLLLASFNVFEIQPYISTSFVSPFNRFFGLVLAFDCYGKKIYQHFIIHFGGHSLLLLLTIYIGLELLGHKGSTCGKLLEIA